MEYEDFLDLARKRRSIRRFRPDPVPGQCIDRIIEAASWAPSGFNIQPWEFVVVRRRDLMDRIIRLVQDYRAEHFPKMEPTREPELGPAWRPYHNPDMDWTRAPVFILLFGDTRAKAGLPMTVRFNPEKREAIFTSSLANAFLYMHLAAASQGLASQWVTAVRVPLIHCQIKDMLGIPAALEIYDLMVLGYPAVTPRPKYRRDIKEMIHYDDCGRGDFRSDEQVNDFTGRTRSWAMAAVRLGPDEKNEG